MENKLRDRLIPPGALPAPIERAIANFERDNRPLPDRRLETLLDAWLRWEGIQGYTVPIVEAFEHLLDGVLAAPRPIDPLTKALAGLKARIAADRPSRLVHVCAYSVTRVYGGPEEGGWYYDAGEALASVPVLIQLQYLSAEYCHCDHGSDDEPADCGCGPNETICHGEVTAEAIEASEEVQQIRAHLLAIFEAEGIGTENRRAGRTRTSAAGEEDLEVRVEDQPAQGFPQKTPRFE